MLPKNVHIVEVGPRDGFQNVKEYIPLETKMDVIRRIYEAGAKRIQVTSFVSPRAIPQMRDAADVARLALERFPEAELFALVPNFKGAELAAAAGLKEISTVISLSQSHNKANVGRTVSESIEGVERIINAFPDMKLGLDIATAFACPFEGTLETEALLALVGKLHDLGVRSYTLCDTTGVAYPSMMVERLKTVKREFVDSKFGIHIHDTRNMGILNSFLGLEAGADFVQTALGGLGGCPFAPGASGNTATEDFLYMLKCEGVQTGIDFEALLDAAKYLYANVKGNYSGHHIKIGSCCE